MTTRSPKAHKYHWVRNGTEVLRDVGILADGTLHNPRGYPEDIVRAAIARSLEREALRRSEAAKKATATRARRHEKRLYEVIEKLRLGHKFGPATHCVVCGKGLGDSESLERGIGSDCWQQIVARLEQAIRYAGPPPGPECFICRRRPGTISSVLPIGVRYTCDQCEIPLDVRWPYPEWDLYCPICRKETVVTSFDAIEPFFSDDTKYNLELPYSAMCRNCDAVLRTSHPTPEAALAHWRDYASVL